MNQHASGMPERCTLVGQAFHFQLVAILRDDMIVLDRVALMQHNVCNSPLMLRVVVSLATTLPPPRMARPVLQLLQVLRRLQSAQIVLKSLETILKRVLRI